MILAAVFLAGCVVGGLVIAFAWCLLDSSSVRRPVEVIDLTGMRRGGGA